ncbi:MULTISPECIES: recombinase RecT [unclassified Crossiella]|uniref:recombinase RecT n=1 Tax=unclassified Crossiella TaxID=2620835 RepID=UPI0020005503|nr:MULTISPECIES: recombinase RecT [unclassified Crossiella]MCK2240963.1 recombinase RecT [Crossiella sp. S99.2]MCK2253893.1 recombinase RecT [Crossiella sp. S99.1]
MSKPTQALGDKIAQVAAELPAAPATQEAKARTRHVAQWLEDKAELFALASSEDFARHLIRDAITSLRATRNLAKAEPYSVLGAVMTCAQLRLRPLNGRAWILPFWDSTAGVHRATVIVGYRGLIDLAFRSGFVRTICARAVHEGETFDIDYGTGAVVHKPVHRGRPGPAYGYYATVEYVTGGRYPLFMTREQVEDHRDRHARARDENNQPIGPWRTDFDAMARKTPLRLLLGDVPAEPTSQPLATALAVDGRLRVDLTPEADPAAVSHRADGITIEDAG